MKTEIEPTGYFYYDGNGREVKSYPCGTCENMSKYSNEELDDHMKYCKCADCEGLTKEPYYLQGQLDKTRLAALDDCKTLLERESKAWDMTMGKTPKITPSPHLVIEKALAELEALKTSLGKEVLTRNADDKK